MLVEVTERCYTAEMPLHRRVELALQAHLDTQDAEVQKELHSWLLDVMDNALIRAVMFHTDGNQSYAARLLGMSRTTLRKKLAQACA